MRGMHLRLAMHEISLCHSAEMHSGRTVDPGLQLAYASVECLYLEICSSQLCLDLAPKTLLVASEPEDLEEVLSSILDLSFDQESTGKRFELFCTS